jgi:NCAIR mutase (PurE)-related protein
MSVPEVRPDTGRGERVGLDEAIFCAGKTAGQIEFILREARGRGAGLLLTRLDDARLNALSADTRAALDYDALSRTAFFGAAHTNASTGTREPRVAILSAGTSDVAAAREAQRTLAWYGEAAAEFYDVGVAGLWRLTDRLDEIRRFPVLIVAAGMDAALVSVVGGLVRGCVIGLPTSVGYGVASGGHTALNAMLASCAPGVAVVNIDNGYGAACIALRMLRAFAPAA